MESPEGYITHLLNLLELTYLAITLVKTPQAKWPYSIQGLDL